MGSDPPPPLHSSRPQEKPKWGAAAIPSFSPVGCRWQCQHPGMEQVSRAPPTLAVPLLTDLGRGAGSRLPPTSPPRRWHGQPAQVALCHGRLGPAACNVPRKGHIPATAQLRDKSQPRTPLPWHRGCRAEVGTRDRSWMLPQPLPNSVLWHWRQSPIKY